MFCVLQGKRHISFCVMWKNRTDRDSLSDSELVEKACNGVFGRNPAGRKETCHGRF